MLSKLLLTASLGFLSLATAHTFQVPADLADGTYLVSLDANNEHVFETLDVHPLAARGLPNSAKFHALTRRVDFPSGSSAVCQQPLVNDFDEFGSGQAWDQFFNSCNALGGQKLKAKQALVTRAGNAVSFMCNYSSGGNPCSTAEWVDAIGRVRSACSDAPSGKDQTGFFNIPGWSKSYGFTQSGQGFC
ncbi:hypothetical protein B0T14DRAFT_434223 [Immersiella caudata]|uniref:Uncharacterized protein n=1 Tax=Immersiella caudata TaxID=314043 RepID=A0AA39WIQ0_9PEZI|nr:hypothetical protein B0T14DRAFT_434223 [Immersiella caudata]